MIQIREMTVDDINEVAIILRETWIDTYSSIIDKEELDNHTRIERRENILLKNIFDKTKGLFVICADETICGHFMLGLDIDENCTGEIISFYILKKYQQQGIGTYAFQFIYNYFENLKYKDFCLWVFLDNYYAQNFYKKCGMVKTNDTMGSPFSNNPQSIKYVCSLQND